MEIITKKAEETKKTGKILAEEINKKRSRGFIIALRGDLGGGKTTFIQGFAKGLNIKDKITSPTFVIMKKYGFLYHIDCYRIRKKDLLELGFNEIINNKNNIIVIEWAERIKKIIPKDSLWIEFEYLDKNKRKISFK